MTDLLDLLATDRIRCHCEIHSKKRALQTVAELLGASLRDAEPDSTDEDAEPAAMSDMTILDALISRERLGSTGIGHGIALPHSRLAGIDEPMAALVTLKDGVDFEAADEETVDVVLGLVVPEDCNDEHLKILASLARRFSDPEQRDAVRNSTNGSTLLSRLAAPPAT